MSCCTDNDRAVLAVRAAGRCSRGQRGDRGSGPRHGGSVLFVATAVATNGTFFLLFSSFLFSSFLFSSFFLFFLRLCHEDFKVLRMVGNALGTEEAAAVGGDEHVVLDAYAPEVLVGL